MDKTTALPTLPQNEAGNRQQPKIYQAKNSKTYIIRFPSGEEFTGK